MTFLSRRSPFSDHSAIGRVLSEPKYSGGISAFCLNNKPVYVTYCLDDIKLASVGLTITFISVPDWFKSREPVYGLV